MKTNRERADELIKCTMGLLALMQPRTKAEMDMCLALAIELATTMFDQARDELLESQRETGVALAAALNAAGGKQ